MREALLWPLLALAARDLGAALPALAARDLDAALPALAARDLLPLLDARALGADLPLILALAPGAFGAVAALPSVGAAAAARSFSPAARSFSPAARSFSPAALGLGPAALGPSAVLGLSAAALALAALALAALSPAALGLAALGPAALGPAALGPAAGLVGSGDGFGAAAFFGALAARGAAVGFGSGLHASLLFGAATVSSLSTTIALGAFAAAALGAGAPALRPRCLRRARILARICTRRKNTSARHERTNESPRDTHHRILPLVIIRQGKRRLDLQRALPSAAATWRKPDHGDDPPARGTQRCSIEVTGGTPHGHGWRGPAGGARSALSAFRPRSPALVEARILHLYRG